MQHQQDIQTSANGAEKTNGEASTTHNGVLDGGNTPTLKLDKTHKEMVRLIGQYLTDLGFKDTVDHLMKESGCRLDHPDACRFRRGILNGEWKEAENALVQLKGMLEDPDNLVEMKFLILEQKYMELIEKRDDLGALNCLRGEISPLQHNIPKVHKLSNLLFVNHPSELKKVTNWLGSGHESRMALMHQLGSYLPAHIMLPPTRLEKLVMQALQHQISLCEYHNTSYGPLPSGNNDDRASMIAAIGASGCLLSDHKCHKESFPSTCVNTLNDHTDEVLVAAFSPDGNYLATGGKDTFIYIWDVDIESFNITRKHCLQDHNYAVVYVSWSHDSTKLIACLSEDAGELVVWDVEEPRQLCRVSEGTNDCLTTACWYKDNERFVCGGLRGQFYLCNLDGTVLKRWEGVRVQSLAIHSDGKTVLASDTHRRIRAYQLEMAQDENLISEEYGIMSFSLDSTGRFALLNVTSQGVHMWDIQSRTLVRRFRGTTQGHCTIHSCFGGLNEDYVASGSEDKKIYIWHRTRETPVTVLSGHVKTVNCVAWHPHLPSMLVSVSDDMTIRIWGPADDYRNGIQLNISTSSAEDGVDGAANGQLPDGLLSNLDIM